MHRHRRPAVLSVALTACLLAGGSAHAQAKVWVVDSLGLPGTDFTDIQPAVNAAAEGDILLIKGRGAGGYSDVTIQGKSLTLTGELDDLSPALGIVMPRIGRVWVRDLTPGQRVVLQRLDAQVPGPSTLSSLQVTQCEGAVFLEECLFTRSGASLPPGAPAAFVAQDADQLDVVNCIFVGETGFAGLQGGPAVSLIDSNSRLFSANVRGGLGVVAHVPATTPLSATGGGLGLLLAGGELFAAGSAVIGGSGGGGLDDPVQGCFPAARGGTGLRMLATAQGAPQAQLMDTDSTGGAGGLSDGPGCPAALDGSDIAQQAGTLSVSAEPHRPLGTNSPVREGESLFLVVAAQPGDLVFVLFGDPIAPLSDPAWEGLIYQGPGARARLLGLAGPNPIAQGIPIGELGAGVEGLTLGFQPLVLSSAGRVVAGEPAEVLLLDQAF